MTQTDLQLTGDIQIAGDDHELFDRLGDHLADAALQAVSDRGVFHLALSGGSTPEPFYTRLVIDPGFRRFPWKNTHVWIVDERRVPFDDERSNFLMIREIILEHTPMTRRQQHAMPVLEDDPVSLYENELREHVGASTEVGAREQIPRLDYVLLGMGDDAHTASLFPDSPALDESRRWIAVNDGSTVTPPPRVTMTYPLLNAARSVGVLVRGRKKHPTLRRVSDHLAAEGPDPKTLPITGVRPTDGSLTWWLDEEAAVGRSPGPIDLA